MMNSKILWGVLSICCFVGCMDQSGSDSEKTSQLSDTITIVEEQKTIDHVKVAKLTQAIINAIPTSEEVEGLMSEMGKVYQMELLNPIENVSKYQLISEKAVNLGIYLCDLGYISSFNQTQELIFYINCSKKLSEGIGVDKVINEEAVENLELNMDNPDSLQAIIHRIYDETYAFLNETNRLSAATLMVTGGWVEGLYIAMQLIDLQNPHLEMIENLIRQQEVYDQLMELLENFNDDPAARKLHSDLVSLGPVLKKINAQKYDQPEALATLKEKITEIRMDCVAF